jgi:hypothetical protein
LTCRRLVPKVTSGNALVSREEHGQCGGGDPLFAVDALAQLLIGPVRVDRVGNPRLIDMEMESVGERDSESRLFCWQQQCRRGWQHLRERVQCVLIQRSMSGEVLAGASRLGSWGVKVCARICAATEVVKRVGWGDESTPPLRHVNAQEAAELLALARHALCAVEQGCLLHCTARDLPEVVVVVEAMQRHCGMSFVGDESLFSPVYEGLKEVVEHIIYAAGDPVRCGFL